MTTAEVVALAWFLGIVYGFVLGWLGCRAWYLRRRARHVRPAGESARLPAAVNRQAARSAVLRRDWAESNDQSRPVQSVPIQRSGFHRADNSR